MGTNQLDIVQDQFFDYMMAEAIKQDIRVLIENKAKFLLVNCIGHGM